MKIARNKLYLGGALAGGVLLVLWLRRPSTSTPTPAPSSPPAVPGVVTSGAQSFTFDDNVLSPGFGLPLS